MKSKKLKCLYCNCDDENCLVKCCESGKYFCNGIGEDSCSHIVHHLHHNQYHKIQLPPSNSYSKIDFCCFFCQNDNIFELSFIKKKEDGNYCIACSDCINFKHIEYDLSIKSKQDIIFQGSIQRWLVSDRVDSKSPTLEMMDSIEENLRSKQIKYILPIKKSNQMHNNILTNQLPVNKPQISSKPPKQKQKQQGKQKNLNLNINNAKQNKIQNMNFPIKGSTKISKINDDQNSDSGFKFADATSIFTSPVGGQLNKATSNQNKPHQNINDDKKNDTPLIDKALYNKSIEQCFQYIHDINQFKDFNNSSNTGILIDFIFPFYCGESIIFQNTSFFYPIIVTWDKCVIINISSKDDISNFFDFLLKNQSNVIIINKNAMNLIQLKYKTENIISHFKYIDELSLNIKEFMNLKKEYLSESKYLKYTNNIYQNLVQCLYQVTFTPNEMLFLALDALCYQRMI